MRYNIIKLKWEEFLKSYRLKRKLKMQKIDSTVLYETRVIAIWTIIFSAVTQAVFLIIGKWDITVLLGNILGDIAIILNFLLMGITVQNAVKMEEKEAKKLIKSSQGLRTLMLFVFVVIGAALPLFNLWAVVIPLFFPRIAIALRPLWDKDFSGGGENTNEK